MNMAGRQVYKRLNQGALQNTPLLPPQIPIDIEHEYYFVCIILHVHSNNMNLIMKFGCLLHS